MSANIIKIYTDGSCNPMHKIGGWAAIILNKNSKIVLKGQLSNTTHNCMELFAVIKAVEYLKSNSIDYEQLQILSDSQYVVKILDRKEKLKQNNFLTKKGLPIQNVDLVKKIITYLDTFNILFIKVKAHQKKSAEINYNREVDKLARKIVREYNKKN